MADIEIEKAAIAAARRDNDAERTRLEILKSVIVERDHVVAVYHKCPSAAAREKLAFELIGLDTAIDAIESADLLLSVECTGSVT